MSFIIILFLWLIINNVTFGKLRRIIGGDDTEIIKYPHQAALRHVAYNLHICGCVIISHWHILTAAHCLYKREEQYPFVRVQMGSTNLQTNIFLMREIDLVFIHPKYTGTMTPRLLNINDIAVIKLKFGIEFDEYINKIELPTRDVKVGDSGMISGWGVTAYPSEIYPARLKEARMTVVDRTDCMNDIQANVRESQFCTYQGLGIGACCGDSGGPMTRNGKVIGIISLSHPCAIGLPDVYTNVFYYLDYIRHVMET